MFLLIKITSGKYLASGGFDKTVRVRDLSNASQKEVGVFSRHTLNVSDVQWSFDSTELLSGYHSLFFYFIKVEKVFKIGHVSSYDQTCKIWELETGKLSDSFDLEGFVLCSSFCPNSKPKSLFIFSYNIRSW